MVDTSSGEKRPVYTAPTTVTVVTVVPTASTAATAGTTGAYETVSTVSNCTAITDIGMVSTASRTRSSVATISAGTRLGAVTAARGPRSTCGTVAATTTQRQLTLSVDTIRSTLSTVTTPRMPVATTTTIGTDTTILAPVVDTAVGTKGGTVTIADPLNTGTTVCIIPVTLTTDNKPRTDTATDTPTGIANKIGIQMKDTITDTQPGIVSKAGTLMKDTITDTQPGIVNKTDTQITDTITDTQPGIVSKASIVMKDTITDTQPGILNITDTCIKDTISDTKPGFDKSDTCIKDTVSDTQPGIDKTDTCIKDTISDTQPGTFNKTDNKMKDTITDTQPGIIDKTDTQIKDMITDTEPGIVNKTDTQMKDLINDTQPGIPNKTDLQTKDTQNNITLGSVTKAITARVVGTADSKPGMFTTSTTHGTDTKISTHLGPGATLNTPGRDSPCGAKHCSVTTRATAATAGRTVTKAGRRYAPTSTMPSSDTSLVQDMILCPHKLLDKLLVVCPNVDYCEEVLPRCDLQAHLANRCRGAITTCVKCDVGCTFQGPRSALQSHLWECPFRDIDSGSGSLPRLPVLEGEITTIDIQRGCYDLGISVVGGCDTPLVCVVIQEVFPDGVVAKDSRLQPGDQVLEVNGIDLTQVSHWEARQALKQVYPICRLTVYREKAEDQASEKEEILKISLPKIPGKQLGIKLVGKKNGAGLYILEMIEGGLAAADNRLKKDDRILEINCQDMTFGSQEQASQIIQASVDKVQIVVARKSRPQTPDIVRSTSRDCLTNCVRKECILGYMPYKCKEKIITIQKDAAETLGISVAGGVGSPRGDIPIYVTNVQSQGCLARSRQVKKGDVLLTINGRSLLDLTHTDAVGVLKASAEARQVSLKVLEGPETTEGIGNFTPSWKFWLAMPVVCHTTRTVTLERAATGTLGFSIVGGSDAAQGPQAIYIKSIVPNTPAGKDARLRSGDLLLSVNNHSLENVTHTQAVILLKNSRGDVTLRVVSWPGTVV